MKNRFNDVIWYCQYLSFNDVGITTKFPDPKIMQNTKVRNSKKF